MSPQNNVRLFMGHLNPLKTVFGSYFWSIAMLSLKLLQPILLSARIQVSKPDAHLPMHQDIHDAVNLTLWPASLNRRSGSTLGLFPPNVGWLGWKSPLHEFDLMRRNDCGHIKLSQAPLLPLLHSKRCICDRKNILFVIVFSLILGINLATPLLGLILGINLATPLLCSISFGAIIGIQLAPPLFCSVALLWTGIALSLCCQCRLRLGQGGHRMSLRRCNKITESQGSGGCGICHGGYRAPTPTLWSSCP